MWTWIRTKADKSPPTLSIPSFHIFFLPSEYLLKRLCLQKRNSQKANAIHHKNAISICFHKIEAMGMRFSAIKISFTKTFKVAITYWLKRSQSNLLDEAAPPSSSLETTARKSHAWEVIKSLTKWKWQLPKTQKPERKTKKDNILSVFSRHPVKPTSFDQKSFGFFPTLYTRRVRINIPHQASPPGRHHHDP